MSDHAKRRQDRLDRLAELSKLLQDAPAPPAPPVPVVPQKTPKPLVIPPFMVLGRISVERSLKAQIAPVLAQELQKIVDIGVLSPSEARQFSEQTGGKDAAQVIAQAQVALSRLQASTQPVTATQERHELKPMQWEPQEVSGLAKHAPTLEQAPEAAEVPPAKGEPVLGSGAMRAVFGHIPGVPKTAFSDVPKWLDEPHILVTRRKRPDAHDWNPVAFALRLMKKKGVTHKILNNLFIYNAALNPFLHAWQEANQETNAFGM